MSAPGAVGELLLDLTPFGAFPVIQAGPPWSGAGNPTSFPIPIPPFPALFAFRAYVQGLILDPFLTFGIKFGLTDAVELLVGP